ncbi:hypothetical protein LCGC14_1305720 [marine sediment metagenome]|uniref:Uncharacterized protein n=1 Tax=marine sediment metagenome TaxID=412755 RepID=A0A0F9KNV1_9ZZZZ
MVYNTTMKDTITKPKHCWMCDRFYPRTTDYFNKNRTLYGGGFENTCKECKKKLNMAHRIKNGYVVQPRINKKARKK